MKKLLVVLVGLTMVTALNAATCRWTATGVYQPGTTTVASGYLGYLFLTSSTVGADNVVASTSAVESAITAGTFATDYGVNSLYYATGASNASGVIGVTGLGSYGAGDTVTAFMVVFDAATVADAQNYAISDTVDVAWTSGNGSQSATFLNFSANNSWQAIPEPTSGMLLLVGGALLALKRKRA